MNSSTIFTTLTTSDPNGNMLTIPVYWGYLSLAFCIFFFASHSLPVKLLQTGDGIFYQLPLCMGVWSVGLIVNCIRHLPTFYFLPMVGGFIWTSSNLCAVPMIKTIGIGLSTLLWGTTTILFGWANARFGFFGTKKEEPSHLVLNYLSVALTALSACFYIFIKIESPTQRSDEYQPLLGENQENAQESTENKAFFELLQPKYKRLLGIFLAILSGILNAISYKPYQYVIDNFEESSKDGLDYVFSMYSGILLFSILYVTLYLAIKRNRPYVNTSAILPGFASGFVWGLGNCSFLFSNSILGQEITFPIATSLRIALASLYGIFLLKEIKGKRNFLFLSIGFCFTASGSILCGISK